MEKVKNNYSEKFYKILYQLLKNNNKSPNEILLIIQQRYEKQISVAKRIQSFGININKFYLNDPTNRYKNSFKLSIQLDQIQEDQKSKTNLQQDQDTFLKYNSDQKMYYSNQSKQKIFEEIPDKISECNENIQNQNQPQESYDIDKNDMNYDQIQIQMNNNETRKDKNLEQNELEKSIQDKIEDSLNQIKSQKNQKIQSCIVNHDIETKLRTNEENQRIDVLENQDQIFNNEQIQIKAQEYHTKDRQQNQMNFDDEKNKIVEWQETEKIQQPNQRDYQQKNDDIKDLQIQDNDNSLDIKDNDDDEYIEDDQQDEFQTNKDQSKNSTISNSRAKAPILARQKYEIQNIQSNQNIEINQTNNKRIIEKAQEFLENINQQEKHVKNQQIFA